MKIVFISDTHAKHGLLKTQDLPEADIIIHAGDISTRGYKHEIEDFLYWYSRLDQYKHKIFCAGNHDFFFEADRETAMNLIPENVIYLEDSSVVIEGIKIWGSPVSPYFHNWAFNRERGKDINKYWQNIPNDVDILLTHTPPYNILDKTVYYEYVGCEDLRKGYLKSNPKFMCLAISMKPMGSMVKKVFFFLMPV